MATIDVKIQKPKRVEKQWGYELWVHNDEQYCGKLLVFNNAGDHFSMHYHMIKNETWYIQEGAFQFDWIDGEKAERCYTQLQKGDVVYIQKGLNDSAFDRSFHTYLTTAFLKRGISVSKQPTKATVFNYSAETYLYSRINGEKTPLTYASFWAVLNKIRVDNKTASTDMIANNFLAYGLIWDYFAAKNNVTDAEVVLTISVEEANTVKYKDSTEFYIERNDLPMYWSDKPASPIRLDGAQSDKPLKTVSIPVTK